MESFNIESYKIIFENFFNYYGLAGIDRLDTYKKVYFGVINCFLDNFIKIIDTRTLTYRRCLFMQIFIKNLFDNQYFFINITNIKYLTDTISKIAEIEINTNKNELNEISIYTILFYTIFFKKYIKENYKNIGLILKMLEEKIKKYINIIRKYEINSENYNFHNISYIILNKYLYNFYINFENDKFYNKGLIKNIVDTLKNYIEKIIIFKCEKIDYDLTEINKNYLLNNFLSKDQKILEKYNFKNIFKNEVIKILKKFKKTSEDKEISENINLSDKEKNFLEFLFLYEFINMDDKKTRNLVFKIFENYYNKFIISDINAKDFEFLIILCFSTTNLMEKSDMDKNFKKNYFQKLKKLLSFETEINEFINNKDSKDFKKLSIINFINSIIKSDLNILKNLEKLNKKNFKVLMIKIIDNFKILDKFYDTETNNNSEFRRTTYNDFKSIIFYFKIVNENDIPTFYWDENKIRKVIYEHFEKIFIFNSDSENELEPKPKKQRLE